MWSWGSAVERREDRNHYNGEVQETVRSHKVIHYTSEVFQDGGGVKVESQVVMKGLGTVQQSINLCRAGIDHRSWRQSRSLMAYISSNEKVFHKTDG